MRVLLTSLVVGAIAASCAGASDVQRSGEVAVRINLSSGTYGGVGLGSAMTRVESVFGPPLETEGAAAPLASERFRGPTFIPLPGALGPQEPPLKQPPPILRYEDAAFLTDGETVYAVIVEAADAKTERGISIGDPLDAALEAYELKCESVVGSGDKDVYRGCFGKLGRDRYVWFGGDPIANISVALVPLTAGPDHA